MTDEAVAQDTLFQLTGVGVVQTDMTTGRFMRANETFCAMVGYGEDELEGMTYLELTHPDDRARDAESFAGLQRGEHEEGTSLTRVLHKGGRVVWLELHVTVVGEGEEAINLTVVNDVTERKRADEVLRESEKKYHTLFDSIDEGFSTVEVLFDESEKAVDYRFLQVNPAFERQTGIKNAVGRWMREVAPEHEEHWFELYGRVALTGEPVRFVQEAAELGRWYDVYAFRVEGPELRRVGILFNDITERRRAEAALRESEKRLHTLVRNLPGSAAFLLDRDLRYVLADGEAVYATGGAPADFEGKTVHEALSSETLAHVEPPLRQALLGEAFEAERTEGDYTFVSRGVPLRGEGDEVTGVLVVSYDISAQTGRGGARGPQRDPRAAGRGAYRAA